MTPNAIRLAKRIAHEVWDKYDDAHGYKAEKQALNAKIPEDHPDNIWGVWNQFDSKNQGEFVERVETALDTKEPGARELLTWVYPNYVASVNASKRLKEKYGVEL